MIYIYFKGIEQLFLIASVFPNVKLQNRAVDDVQ